MAVSPKKSAGESFSIKGNDLSAIYAENVTAKIFQVAQRGLLQQAPLKTYPHHVFQTGPDAGTYSHREALFWTCGFFPGSIYTLLERCTKYPKSIQIPTCSPAELYDGLLHSGRHWSVAINEMSGRTDTHDMGFIVQPALQKDWELTGNRKSLESVKKAAYALASRWDDKVKAIRSWDVAINDRYSITDMEENFLVIIDSMCNLDLLYFVGHTFHDNNLVNLATQHATTIMREILRPNYSSYHLVNFSPRTGDAQAKMTNQGHADESTWTRGQAWSIMGFAQTYTWTKDVKFLETAIKCAEYFLERLKEGKGRWECESVPVWDFDATEGEGKDVLRDVSAGVIAANGLAIIHQSLQGLPDSTTKQLPGTGTNFLDAALRIVSETLEFALDRDFASLETGSRLTDGANSDIAIDIKVKESGFDAILRHSTSNNNEHAHQPYKDHGLVYADYYLLEFGNKLLRAGLI